MAPSQGPQRSCDCPAHGHRALESLSPFCYQIKTYMPSPAFMLLETCLRQLKRFAGHLAFRGVTPGGDLFNHVPAAVARGKIHFAVDALWVLAQGVLDDAHRLDKLAPISGIQEPEAGDAVAD